MWNLFKKKRKTILDNVLGTLTFMKSKGDNESYWKVNRSVKSVNDLVEFCLMNDEQGINQNQKRIILEIEKTYPNLVNTIEKYINNSLENKSNISIENDLEISYILIPENPTESYKWEICFQEKNGFTHYEIEIENWNPVDFGISA